MSVRPIRTGAFEILTGRPVVSQVQSGLKLTGLRRGAFSRAVDKESLVLKTAKEVAS